MSDAQSASGGVHENDDGLETMATWSQFEARASAATSSKSPASSASSTDSADNLTRLPDAVRAIVERCRAEQRHPTESATGDNDVECLDGAADGHKPPYTCRLYESVPGEEELLQLQWMRIDMSNMDSEQCWGEDTGCKEDYEGRPESSLMLPAVYSVDPAQLFPLTFVGLPPELLSVRDEQGSSHQRVEQEEMLEDDLCKLGADVTEALSGSHDRQGEGSGLPDSVVYTVASMARPDWDACLERHVDLRRCNPCAFVELLSTSVPPTLNCMLDTVLPSFIAGISSSSKHVAISGSNATTGKGRGRESDGNRHRGSGYCKANDEDEMGAIRTLCVMTGQLAKAERQDPVQFRDRVSASGLRDLGAVGREAEVLLAEAFFSRDSHRP